MYLILTPQGYEIYCNLYFLSTYDCNLNYIFMIIVIIALWKKVELEKSILRRVIRYNNWISHYLGQVF